MQEDINSLDYLYRCRGCKELKLNSEYRKYNKEKAKRKFATKCKKCADLLNSVWVKNNLEKVKINKQRYIDKQPKEVVNKRHTDGVNKNYFKYVYHRSKNNAKKRNLFFNITEKDLENIWNNQEGRCYYTNTQMTKIKYDHFNMGSVDRIDSSKGYVLNNIVFCTYKVNVVKNDLSYENLIEFCKKILKTDEKRKTNLGDR